MKSRTTRLLSATLAPLAAAAALAVGTATPASACGFGEKSAALPEAKARDGRTILAMSHEKKACAPCGANPCAAKAKAEDMANPCAVKTKAEEMAKDKAKEMANPCAANPCAPKIQ